MSGNSWTRDELIVVLDLYLNHPEVGTQISDERVKEWADRIGRTPGSISSRIGNYQSLDPQSSVGMGRWSEESKEVWEEYYGHKDHLRFEAECALKRLRVKRHSDDTASSSNREVETGEEATSGTTRIGQKDFRAAVRERHDDECVICGLAHSGLLQASHILSWSDEPELRGDPANALLLCYNHHRAFDLGMFTLTADHEVLVRDDIAQTEIGREILNRSPIDLKGSSPSIEYLRRRNERLPWVHREK